MVKFALPIVILIAIVAFVGGVTLKNFFVSPYNLALDVDSLNQEASNSAQITQDQTNLPGANNLSIPAATNQHQLPNNSGSYTSTISEDKVVINGNFRIPDFYKLNYNFVFPKKGGDITGRISGVCDGTINGKSDKPDSDGEARIEGAFSGDCKPIPGLSFKTKASGNFEGQLQFKENKVHIIYILNEPYQTRGGFELAF